MYIRAYSKINIGLRVFKKSEGESLHRIDSYMAKIELSDDIYVETRYGRGLYIGRMGRYSDYLKEGERDIIERAYEAFLVRYHGRDFALEVKINKRIPPMSGLGGASSDAAAVLMALNRELNYPFTGYELNDIAFSIGSDVPFFMSSNQTCRVRGYGDQITEVDDIPKYKVILLHKRDSYTSTGEAYDLLDSVLYNVEPLPDSLSPIDRNRFINDFEIVTSDDSLYEIESSLEEGRFFSLTGSGSYYYVLLDADDALSTEEKIGLELHGFALEETSLI